MSSDETRPHVTCALFEGARAARHAPSTRRAECIAEVVEKPIHAFRRCFGGRALTPYEQVSVIFGVHWRRAPRLPLSVQDGTGARRMYCMPASWHLGVLRVTAWF